MPHFIQVETAHNVKIEFEVASLWHRMLGYIVDLVVIISYLMISAWLFDQLFGSWYRFKNSYGKVLGVVFEILYYVPIMFYHPLMEVFFNGQTIGKMATRIRVVSNDGKPVSLGSYVLRWLFRPVEILMVWGVIAMTAIGVNGKGQRLGDMAAGTAVISLRPNSTIRSNAFVKLPADYVPEYPEVKEKLSGEDGALIKEVLMLKQENRYELIGKVAEKVQETLEVPMRERAHPYLQTILKDYNYYNNNEVDVEAEIRNS